jgi:3-hydroxyethyl bacteriochlorophyllide a dehydrogenase
MHTTAVILEKPGALGLAPAELRPIGHDDLLVDVEWSGISSGTERLLWSGRMPPFPGMGYPLVPGYETVGRVVDRGAGAMTPLGTRVFVPGATSFRNVRSLFGGAAQRLVVAAGRCVALGDSASDEATLLALAATAHHIAPLDGAQPDLIVGHGALGRLLARLVVLSGAMPPVVWERDPRRRSGAAGYAVVAPEDDDRRDYRRICDVSGSVEILDELVSRLAPGGEIVLGGFYDRSIAFAFAPAFLREARIRVAAQWQPADLAAVTAAVTDRRLSLAGLVTHRAAADQAFDAYRQAFEDADCLKMCLDWRTIS